MSTIEYDGKEFTKPAWLTEEQFALANKALGNERDFPMATNDPKVNAFVDFVIETTAGDGFDEWPDLDEEIRQAYIEEAALPLDGQLTLASLAE